MSVDGNVLRDNLLKISDFALTLSTRFFREIPCQDAETGPDFISILISYHARR